MLPTAKFLTTTYRNQYMQQARDAVAKEFESVNQLIVDHLHSDVPMVENIGHYIVEAGGKRLRPMLVLLAGGACGNLTEKHITLAAVIEFIHTATLLHDDVVDLSALRRGRPTANAEWGNAPSVLVGDFLYTRAFQLLVKLGNMEVMSLMAAATNTIAEGEVLQLTKAGDPNTSEEDYFKVIRNKTAVLFAAATSCSAILAGASKTESDALYQYGLNLGIAFQLTDDILDYEGEAAEMGKDVGDDLSEGKPTLPLIFAMKNGSKEQSDLIKSAIVDKSSEHINTIISTVKTTGAIDYTRKTAEKKSSLATESIKDFPSSAYKQSLLRLASLAVSRTA
jgi:octaprenyl-diphosphate synthase